ncbi:hypothetical protein Tco_0945783, partial [Tanacetum coccineum]
EFDEHLVDEDDTVVLGNDGKVGNENLGCTETPPGCRITYPKRFGNGKRRETPGKRPREKWKRFFNWGTPILN